MVLCSGSGSVPARTREPARSWRHWPGASARLLRVDGLPSGSRPRRAGERPRRNPGERAGTGTPACLLPGSDRLGRVLGPVAQPALRGPKVLTPDLAQGRAL